MFRFIVFGLLKSWSLYASSVVHRAVGPLRLCNLSANIEAKIGKLSKMAISLSEFNNSIFTLNGS